VLQSQALHSNPRKRKPQKKKRKNKRKERGRRPKLIKPEVRTGLLQQVSMEFRGLLGNTLKTGILINWKTWKKWIHF
jgi:hypothetical protein